MRIAILGSGLMGAKLGTIFARAGHEVTFSYSRDQQKLDRLARDAGNGARAASARDAARDADAVLVAVNWPQLDDLLRQAGDLAGKIVITCSLHMNAEMTGLAVGHTTSSAEELAAKVPRARVVSAFASIPSELPFAVYHARGSRPAPNVLYCGDDADAKGVATRLIRDVGFEPTDVGPLRSARYIEQFTMIVGKLAYETEDGPAIAYRFERYEERDA